MKLINRSLFTRTAAKIGVVSGMFLSAPAAFGATEKTTFKFDFGPGSVEPGYTQIAQATAYNKQTGYGFENAAGVSFVDRGAPDALRGDFVTGDKPFLFSVAVPEGNYNVTVTLGDQTAESTTVVKAEARRLMLERVDTTPGKFESRTFTVNVRTPAIASGGAVRINGREQGPPLVAHWDEKLTLEFNGKRPCLAALEIARADDAITVYLAGDSTVTDQPNEPWAGWGQMLTRFFKPGVAIANHAESGLALTSFRSQRRLEKILSTMKAGDYLFIQFGHNDQKDKSPGAGPFTTYKANLKQYVAAARAKGGIPVLVTSMERRRFSPQGKAELTLADFAEAVRQAGKEENVPVIDLAPMSLKLYEALGPENSSKAFVHYAAGTFPGQDKALKDNTHHNPYGGYELARCMVEGIKSLDLDLKKHLIDNLPTFDPSRPDPVDSWSLPASPGAVIEKPAGS